MFRRVMIPAVVATVAFSLAGCNSQDASDLTQDVGKIAKDAGRAAGNAQLVARINAELAQRKGVDMSGLHVSAVNGVVTVGGHVRDKGEKRKVLQTINDIRGVTSVVDQLHVQPR